MKKLLKIKTYFARHLSLQGYLWGGAQIFHTSERLSQWVNLFKSMADNFAILGQWDGQVTCHGLFRHGMCVNMWPNLTMQVFISNGGFIKLNVKWILSVFGQLNCPSLLTGYFYRMLENTEGCLGYFIKFNSCYGCCLERKWRGGRTFAYFLGFVTFDVAGAKKCSEESKLWLLWQHCFYNTDWDGAWCGWPARGNVNISVNIFCQSVNSIHIANKPLQLSR